MLTKAVAVILHAPPALYAVVVGTTSGASPQARFLLHLQGVAVIGVVKPTPVEGTRLVVRFARRKPVPHPVRLTPPRRTQTTGHVPLPEIPRATTVLIQLDPRTAAVVRVARALISVRAPPATAVPVHVEIAEVGAKAGTDEIDTGPCLYGPHRELVLVLKLSDAAPQVSVKTASDT